MVQRALLVRGNGAFALVGNLLAPPEGGRSWERALSLLYEREGVVHRVPLTLEMARTSDGPPGCLRLGTGRAFADFDALMQAVLPTLDLGVGTDAVLHSAEEWPCLQLQASRDSCAQWLALQAVRGSKLRLACVRLSTSTSQGTHAAVSFLDHGGTVRHTFVDMRADDNRRGGYTFAIEHLGEWPCLGDVMVRKRKEDMDMRRKNGETDRGQEGGEWKSREGERGVGGG